MSEVQLNISDLATELIDWLQTDVSIEQVIEYVTSISENKKDVFFEIQDAVLFRARLERRYFFEKHFDKPLVKLLSEVDAISFIDSCAIYDASSVVKNFSAKYPELIDCRVLENPAMAARKYIILYNKVVLFLVADIYSAQSRTLVSLLNLNLQKNEYLTLQTRLNVFIGQYEESYIKENFEEVEVDAAQREELREIFSILSFIPKAEVEDYIADLGEISMIDSLTEIRDLITVVLAGFEINEPLQNMQFYKDLLLRSLQSRKDKQLIQDRITEKAADKEEDYSANLGEYFTFLFRPQYMKNGILESELVKAFGLLSREMKDSFKESLNYFLVSSHEVSVAIAPLNIDSFLFNLEKAGNKQTSDNLISDLSLKIDEEARSRGLEILKAIARVYYP